MKAVIFAGRLDGNICTKTSAHQRPREEIDGKSIL
jgi:hypothetical protein